MARPKPTYIVSVMMRTTRSGGHRWYMACKQGAVIVHTNLQAGTAEEARAEAQKLHPLARVWLPRFDPEPKL